MEPDTMVQYLYTIQSSFVFGKRSSLLALVKSEDSTQEKWSGNFLFSSHTIATILNILH